MIRPPGLLAAFVVLAGLLAADPAAAAINPELFKKGPEELVVRVTGRSVRSYGEVVTVRLLAEVVSVARTATGLTPGAAILISYDRDPGRVNRESAEQERKARQGWVGPQVLHAPEPPAVGEVVRAYLQRVGADDGRVYRPTAHQYSFERP